MQIRIVFAAAVLSLAHTSLAFDASPDASPQPQRHSWQTPAAIDDPRVAAIFDAERADPSRAVSSFISVNDDPEGDMPRDLAFLQDGSAVVIANQDSDTVTFLDADTRTITDTLAVGDYPVDVAVTPDNRYAVVPCVLSNEVAVIDVASRTLAALIPITGLQPYRVAVTADSRYAVVGVINDAISSAFSVIDLDTLSESLSFASASQGVIGFFFTPESGISSALFTQFALTPDGSKILYPDRGGARVLIYDRAAGTQLASLATSASPSAVDVSSDGTLAVVTHEFGVRRLTTIDPNALSISATLVTTADFSDGVVRITPDKTHAIGAILNNAVFVNLTTGATAATISTGTVGDIELSFDGQFAFVSNFNSSVINVATRTLAKTLTLAACADAAVSPVDHRAVALNNRFREDAQVYNINGAAGFVEGLSLSGAAPEGDATRDLAISADGRIAVACNNTSRNVAIIDLRTQLVRSYVDVGERPLDVAITPDGQTAVVCAADANAVKIIDLNTDAVVATLPVFTRPARVRVSPDSQFAYVLNVAAPDQISFIQLNGAGSTILSQITAGETGSALGYTYSEISGIELSPDGATLAVCDSFNDRLRLYDTATRTLLTTVTVGDFPIRVAFNPAGTRAYVANAFSDNVSVVNVAGAGSTLITSTGAFDFPLTVNVDDAGAFAYIGNSGTSPGIRVLDAATNTIVATVSFGSDSPRDVAYSPLDSVLYAGTVNGTVTRVSAAGAASAILDTLTISGSPSDVVYDDRRARVILAQPVPDGVDLVQFGCDADLDGDRTVTLSDLGLLLADWACAGGGCVGDADEDGDTDLSDLGILLADFGALCD